MNGRIADIKRLAVHDGPGIRTTIFLKGCSLRCNWCHNPETIDAKPEIAYIPQKCGACGRCVQVCPNQAHSFSDGKHFFNRDQCNACGKCVKACFNEALELYGYELSVEDALDAVLEDKTFYEQSGGGCTVSGGEPLLQAEFCAALFKRLKAEGVHCAVDTSGAVPWSAFETVLPYTDIFLYDLKHTDEARHREQVGAPNRQIIDNLRRLSGCGVPIEIRIPVIPGFNDDDESMTNAGGLLEGLDNIAGVRLLPYHFAHHKYLAVGHDDTMAENELVPEAITRALEILKKSGLTLK